VRIRRRIARRRHAIAVLASLAVAAGAPAAALAVPADAPVAKYPRPVNPELTVTPSDFAKVVPASRGGVTPAEVSQSGDSPSDYASVTRAKFDPPRTITVVRPERTVVRDADTVLPVILASLALLVALGIAGTALVRQRSMRLGRAG
jgi:hypothetical protein